MAGLSDYSNNSNFVTHSPSMRDFCLTDHVDDRPNLRDHRSAHQIELDQKSELQVKSIVDNTTYIVNIITENVLSHPFIVLRRQCQVHYYSRKYHITPVTLLPTLFHLHQSQGLSVLYKGLGSSLLVRAITVGTEDILSKTTSWPKELTMRTSLKKVFQHSLLKSISLTIVMPFYSASLVETVQSAIASDKPGLLDVCHEALLRVTNWRNVKGRMLPIYIIFLPTLTLGLLRYFVTRIIKGGTGYVLQYQENQTSKDKTTVNTGQFSSDVELNSSLISNVVADVLLFPFETILHRLYLQGTRTIIDNLDDGKSVLSIMTNYTGPFDCYEICVTKEGTMGLYKGFGALVLQYLAHILVIRLAKFAVTELVTMIYEPKKLNSK